MGNTPCPSPARLDGQGLFLYNTNGMQKEWYRIEGGHRLEGTVTISGAKNAAVAIIPAAILSGECCVLENLPHIQDVRALQTILTQIGAEVDFTSGDCMRIDASKITSTTVVSPEVAQMRASYYLLGAMLGRFGGSMRARTSSMRVQASSSERRSSSMWSASARRSTSCSLPAARKASRC